ncbi:MAG: SDR family oxidoreductase [Rhizobiaceae bacterium]|nr:SDR family oxidoreductase [Rhizobiaceae bacterium]
MQDELEADDMVALRPQNLFDLSGKVAIVTGAAGGLGSWISAGLAASGASVVMTDLSAGAIDRTASAIRKAGADILEVACDLTAENAPAGIVEAALARYGRVDVLVNNAGANRRERIFDVQEESWELIANLNLKIPFELSRKCAGEMAKGSGGSIIHVGSLNNAIGLQGVSVYGAHKAAMCQLAKSMSVEWASLGIRVNAICPGFMLTPLSEPLWQDPKRGPWLLERSLLKRPGYPREIVGICLLLASEAGSFMTGQTYYVDGGWLAGTPWDA